MATTYVDPRRRNELAAKHFTPAEMAGLTSGFALGRKSIRVIATLEADNKALREALEEIQLGDGVYYITQERAMAPGISGEWPEVIPAPHTPHGRLVKRKLEAQP